MHRVEHKSLGIYTSTVINLTMNDKMTPQTVADGNTTCRENHDFVTTPSKVRRTDAVDGNISRERICHKCGHHFFSTEISNNAIEEASRKWMIEMKVIRQEKAVLEDLIVRMYKANRAGEKIAEDAQAYCERAGL